jgi:transcriptional regulator with XRE-family HTH domain
MNKNYIGENIRIYRERNNMTQKDLGDKIGKTWEMVSRYERGVSSPFKQIDSLADALNVDSSELLKKPSENKNYLLNRVPLFTTIPENMDFLNTKAYEYYTAPDWMLDRDLQCFVIDSKLIDIRDNRLDDDGYLFISPNLKNEAKQDDLVLKIDDDQLVASKRFNSKEDTLVGKVLAQEVRF